MKAKKYEDGLLSDCCNAKVRLSEPMADFIGDNPQTQLVGTVHYVCSACGEACNISGENDKQEETLNPYFSKANAILSAKRNDYASETNKFKNFEEASKIASIMSQKEITVEDVFNCILGIKMSREANLRHNVAEIKNEPLEDTIIDLLNYTALKAEALQNG